MWADQIEPGMDCVKFQCPNTSQIDPKEMIVLETEMEQKMMKETNPQDLI
jgi:hypothetical protein